MYMIIILFAQAPKTHLSKHQDFQVVKRPSRS